MECSAAITVSLVLRSLGRGGESRVQNSCWLMIMRDYTTYIYYLYTCYCSICRNYVSHWQSAGSGPFFRWSQVDANLRSNPRPGDADPVFKNPRSFHFAGWFIGIPLFNYYYPQYIYNYIYR